MLIQSGLKGRRIGRGHGLVVQFQRTGRARSVCLIYTDCYTVHHWSMILNKSAKEDTCQRRKFDTIHYHTVSHCLLVFVFSLSRDLRDLGEGGEGQSETWRLFLPLLQFGGDPGRMAVSCWQWPFRTRGSGRRTKFSTWLDVLRGSKSQAFLKPCLLFS